MYVMFMCICIYYILGLSVQLQTYVQARLTVPQLSVPMLRALSSPQLYCPLRRWTAGSVEWGSTPNRGSASCSRQRWSRWWSPPAWPCVDQDSPEQFGSSASCEHASSPSLFSEVSSVTRRYVCTYSIYWIALSTTHTHTYFGEHIHKGGTLM